MGLGWVIGLSLLGGAVAKDVPIVATKCGLVEGFEGTHGVSRYWGIPFAEPPVGELRWKPPVPGKCWEGTLKANKIPPPCINHPAVKNQSEDCLTLDIWAPKNTSVPKPVLVWLHGGSLVEGDGISPGYMPSDEMTDRMDVVSVSFNYRLAAFGFLALAELSEESPLDTSGNYGLLDAIEVLRWVKDNIRDFGGDPGSVTLLGQSSGGTLQYAMLAAPSAKGLFHKSVLMSGSARQNNTLAHAQHADKIIWGRSGCSDLKCLRSLSAEEISRITPWHTYPNWSHPSDMSLPTKGNFEMNPITVDGVIVTAPFDIAWREGKANYVPLIVGNCAQEIDLGPPFPVNGTAAQLHEMVQKLLGPFGKNVADKAESLYPVGGDTPTFTFTSMGSDVRETCPVNLVSRQMYAKNRPPIYRYVTTEWPTYPVSVYGYPAEYAFHASDALFLFNSSWVYNGGKPQGVSNNMYTRRFRRDLKEFMLTGAISSWEEYPKSTMLLSGYGFDPHPGDYHAEQCSFWESEVGFAYSWNN